MKANQRIHVSRFTRIAMLATGILTLSLWAAPDNAFADSRGRRHHRVHRGHDSRDHRSAQHFRGHGSRHHQPRHRFHGHDFRYQGRRHFAVPRSIHHRHLPQYRPYLLGPVFYSPHRHYHRLYRFPVYTEVGLAYEPHFYCGDDLFVGGHVGFHGPQFGISVAF